MSQRNRHFYPILGPAVLGFLMLSTGCGLVNELLPTSSTSEEDGTSGSGDATSSPNASGFSPATPTTYPTPTTGIAAPEIVSPGPDSELTESTPILVVANALTEDKAPLYYTFELSKDQNFGELIASAQGIPQGNRRTSWQVPEPLTEGRYYWRSRAQAGYVKSPFSAVAAFTIIQVVTTPEPVPGPEPGGGVATLFDPLTDGTSVGDVHGGEFTSQGWRVKSKSDFIRYEIEPSRSGFVEWETAGLRPSNPNHDQYMLLGMWDPTRGDYRANPFRVHVQKLDSNHNRPYVRLRWIANGEQHDEGYHYEDWEPDRVYSWRLEWGPSGGSNKARIYLDGQLIIEATYRRDYLPGALWLELGIAERTESIVGTIYSNVRVGK
jgi:hypothetical protein